MNVYLGTFLVAFTTLALEVTLIRLLSVITWYHLAFFAVSTAMLGMTAGAVTVYLKPNWFAKEKLNNSIAKACLGYSLAAPFALIILCCTPVGFQRSIMSLFPLIVVTTACTLPFYFSGVAITAVLTKYQLPIGKLYASDLAGASLGCLFVLGGLEILNAPGMILLCGSVAILAAFSFARRISRFRLSRISWWIFGTLILLVIINSFTSYGIRPLFVKGQFQDAGNYLLEEWNSFSRVVVYKMRESKPQYWGASPLAPKERVFQYRMNIDGAAGTTLRKFSSIDDIRHLGYDVTNIAYYLRPKGGACIIGFGAGRDVQSAVLFGHERIVGIDINPIFINLLRDQFREFAGIADRKEVTLIVDEARSFLSRTQEDYSIIQMSLTDTWAATGAGAFSLSENTLYTVEAWKTFLNRLSEDGIFTVSRWYNPEHLGETGRVISLASRTLLESGIEKPSQHIAMVTTGRLATLLVSKQPFSNQDIAKLRSISSRLEFEPVVLPDGPPTNEVLKSIVSASSIEELSIAIADEPLNYQPTTDENPYFFNMIRLNHISVAPSSQPGIIAGNVIATLTLVGLILCLFFVSIATIIFPLVLGTRSKRRMGGVGTILWSGAAYFSLIGAGFMFVEIALIQRLSVFLGHPLYALGILLFTIIASAGVGSFLSERIPLTRVPWVFIYPVIIALAIIAIRFAVPTLAANMMSSSMVIKILASILVIMPCGILLGVCFPTGMQLVRSARATETPWYWALNGIFGVLCSALTVFISIYFGISTSFYLAATCYIMLLLCLPHMYKASQVFPSR